uniref:Uncharacterized protein n=1 Tax=Rhizophora mucronata TaxID=61149 RepID=A0A2P2PDL4_RHIMU
MNIQLLYALVRLCLHFHYSLFLTPIMDLPS